MGGNDACRDHHGSSPALVGSFLATQEFVGVVSKLLAGTLFSFPIHPMSSSSLFIKIGTVSAIGFIIQGVAPLVCIPSHYTDSNGHFLYPVSYCYMISFDWLPSYLLESLA